jgi:PKD repeat protein/regulation of enolase protein 1 (concanavalin A-like superfamily)
MNYTQLDVLVVVYTHTVDGIFTDTAGLQREIEESEIFYWRNSHLRLDLAVDVLWIDEYKELDEFWELWPNAYWLTFWDGDDDGNSVTQDLYDRGISDDQYDGVIVYYAWGQGPHGSALGGGTYGVDVGFMGHTGYTAIPLEWALPSQDWYFIHEFHHQLDSMFYYSGYPAYPHADIPHPMPGDFGENYDFNAAILRGWPLADWAGLVPPWHTPASAQDSDDDRLPDDSPNLPVTESSMGADPFLPDSDDDGLDDLGEATAGILGPANPTTADTDADALPDGVDPYPLYPVNRQALSGTITIDGVIGEDEAWRLFDNAPWQLISSEPFSATFYTAWDDDYLYLGLHVSHFAYVRFYLDANNDGWFHGPDNYEIGFDPSYTYPTTWDLWVHVLDASLGTLCANPGGPWPMWDDDPAYPFPRLVQPDDIVRYAQSDGDTGYVAELAIPANANTELLPEPGDVIGLRITLSDLDREWDRSASLFETESFVDLGLVEGLNGTSDLFESPTLAPLWAWVDPLGDCNYSLTDQPGRLRIYAPDGGHDLNLNTNAPRLLQPVSGDFAIQTQVTISPAYSYQGAGLLVWANADNYVRLERAGGAEQQIYLWYRDGGIYGLGGTADVNTTTIHLRFERSGDNFTGLYSLDNVNWTPVGTASLQAGPTVDVGLHVIDEGQDNPIYADFAYFQVTPAYDVAPPTGTLAIDSGAPYTGDPWVLLTLTATDSTGAFRMQLDDGRQLWPPQSYAATWPAVLLDGENTKTVSIRLQDNLGNTSAPISSTVGLDQTPPTASFSLGQDGVTGQVTTTVHSTATDGYAGLATMMFSNEWDWEAEALNHDVGWETYDQDASASAAWVAYGWAHDPGLMVYGPGTYDLPPGRSYRAVFRLKVNDNWVPCPVVTLDVCDHDGQGNERILASRGVAASEFLLPNVYQEFALDFGYPDAGSSGLEFRVHFEDRADVYTDRVLVFGAPQPCSPTTTWQLSSGDGWHTVWGRFVDAAGNITQTQAMALLDTTPPTGSITINDGAIYVASTSVTLTLSGVDAGSGIDQMVVANTSNFSGATWMTYTTLLSWTLTAGTGPRTVYVKFRDRAGNTSSVYSDTITLYDPASANFAANPRYGVAPLTVHFTDTSGGLVAAWEWTFGDGETSTIQHPTHVYTTGVYTVGLTVWLTGELATLAGGTDTLTRTDYITVQEKYTIYLPLTLRNS